MPIFEYSCEECGEAFEILVRSSEQHVSCPGCSSPNIHKLMSLFARSPRGGGESSSSSSGCGSCSGGHCSTCH